LFSIGAVTAVVFLFLPLVDMASIQAKEAPVLVGKKHLDRDIAKDVRAVDKEFREYKEERKKLLEEKKRTADQETRLRELDNKLNSGEYQERRNEAEGAFERKEKWENKKVDLVKEVDEAISASVNRRSWYTLGMMIGFSFVAGGAICYLALPGARRIVGCIVICAELLSIFFSNAIMSIVYSAVMMGPPPDLSGRKNQYFERLRRRSCHCGQA